MKSILELIAFCLCFAGIYLSLVWLVLRFLRATRYPSSCRRCGSVVGALSGGLCDTCLEHVTFEDRKADL